MNDIKVGEFCRTNDGTIGVIEIIEEQYTTIKTQHYHYKIFDKKLIKSHSKNIIDLIEVGDYVNGELVIQKDKYFDWIYIDKTRYEEDRGEEVHEYIKQEEIKSIVTREQFNSIKYVLGGKEE